MVHESVMIGKLNVARDDMGRAKRELEKALRWTEENPDRTESGLRYLINQARFAVDEIDEAESLVWEYENWLSCERFKSIMDTGKVGERSGDQW